MHIYVDSRSLPNNSTSRTMPKTIHEISLHVFFTISPVCHCIYPKPPERYTTLYHLWYLCMRWRGTHATTEGCGAPKQSIICMNWGSRSKFTNFMSWWSSRSPNGRYWSYTTGKGPYKGIIENQEIRKVGLSETHASGIREASTHNEWWKGNWWNKYQQERSRRTWNDEVWEFLKGSEPRRQIEGFFVKMVMEWWMLIFRQFLGFRTHVVATTVCTTGCVHTLTCCTHIFLHIARAQSSSHIFMRVHIHAWLKRANKVFAHVSFLSISPSPFLCPTHPSCSCTVTSRPLPTYDLTDDPVHTSLPNFPVLKAQAMRHSAPASRSLATWPS